MRIDATPVEVIATPAPNEDDYWTIAALAFGLIAGIVKASN